MKTLKEPKKAVTRVLGLQVPEDGIQYRISRYVVQEGTRMYNTLTGEAVEGLSELEQIQHWFRVPDGMDEKMLAYHVRQKQLQMSGGPGQNTKNRYVIFMTTTCNANCVYCYEKGIRAMTMTEKTAQDVGKYIILHSNPDTPVSIRWFGGEPLVNASAIDIISGALNRASLPFKSEIFTNGDLLPGITTERIRDNWHVKTVQFTVDDVGPEYDRIKGLPAGAFDRLCASVKRLTDAGITVNLRTHYWPGKGPDAPMRVAERFCGMPGVMPYCVMLYGGGSAKDYAGLLEVQDYIHRHGGQKIGFPAVKIGMSCMAENRKTACITTDGHLSPCEHHPYGESYGSIYSRNYDKAVVKRWKAKSRNFCSGCVLYPSCGRMALCSAEGSCTPEEIQHQVNRIKYLLRGTSK